MMFNDNNLISEAVEEEARKKAIQALLCSVVGAITEIGSFGLMTASLYYGNEGTVVGISMLILSILSIVPIALSIQWSAYSALITTEHAVKQQITNLVIKLYFILAVIIFWINILVSLLRTIIATDTLIKTVEAVKYIT